MISMALSTATVVGGMSLKDLVREKCPKRPIRPRTVRRGQM